MLTTVLASIPSPDRGVWYLGPVPIRAYALCIIAGIVVAVVWGDRRFAARGGERGVVTDVAVFAVPFGLVGGRLYHVATDWQQYFGPGRDPLDALKIWQGGLGIWGAIALGGVGAWIGCRRRGVPLPFFADAVAPGIVVAQAIGRLGNWFNQELYGGPTDLPWGLEIYQRIDPATGAPDALGGVAVDTTPIAVVHPTFLYELLWNLGVAALVVWADRRFRLGHGRAFAVYVAGYTAGRFWIELMRTDPATTVFGGIRINVVVSAVVFALAVLYIAVARRGREEPFGAAATDAADAAGAADDPAAGDRAADERDPQQPVPAVGVPADGGSSVVSEALARDEGTTGPTGSGSDGDPAGGGAAGRPGTDGAPGTRPGTDGAPGTAETADAAGGSSRVGASAAGGSGGTVAGDEAPEPQADGAALPATAGDPHTGGGGASGEPTGPAEEDAASGARATEEPSGTAASAADGPGGRPTPDASDASASGDEPTRATADGPAGAAADEPTGAAADEPAGGTADEPTGATAGAPQPDATADAASTAAIPDAASTGASAGAAQRPAPNGDTPSGEHPVADGEPGGAANGERATGQPGGGERRKTVRELVAEKERARAEAAEAAADRNR